MVVFPIRDEGTKGAGLPPVTVGLIAANTLIFLWTLLDFERILFTLGVKPVEILVGQNLHTLLTSMFLHGGIEHLLGNMWFLWIFGDNVERHVGRVKFVVFYLLTGIAGSLLHAFTDPASAIPSIGASGAISGVMGAYLMLHPNNRIYTLIGIGIAMASWVKAYWVIGAWFVFQLLLSGFSLLGAQTGVAYLAHVGGFVAGYLLIKPFEWSTTKK